MPDLERMSWDEIGRIAAGGDANQLGLGSTKTERLRDGTSIVLQIIDFYHDEDRDEAFIPVTWETKYILPAKRPINRNGGNSGGWEHSDIRRWLNRDFYGMLSDELQAIIKPAMKQTSVGRGSSEIVRTEDKLWLPSEIEVFGRNEYSYSGEGVQYQLHFDEGASHRKFPSQAAQAPACWWLRSPYRRYDNAFCFVYTDGSPGSYYADCSLGLAVALAT